MPPDDPVLPPSSGRPSEAPPEAPPEHPFDSPWQARAFALTLALHDRGAFGWDEWASSLGAALADDPALPYWLSWLAALERICASKGAAAASDVAAMADAWRRAADRTPHGQPIALDRTDAPGR